MKYAHPKSRDVIYYVSIILAILLCSCKTHKPLATTSHERIETQMQAVPIGSDTIEIEYRLQSTNNRYSFPTDDTDFNAGAATASSVSSVNQRSLSPWRENSVREKENSVRNTNSEGVKSVQIRRATLAQQESESLNPNGKKSFKSVKSVGDNHSEGVTSVRSVNQRSLSPWRENSVREKENSVRNKNNSVRIKSTRALNIESRHTDTTQTLRITLRPDTVYLPYTTHIRSDTIIAPDPTTRAKLTTARWQMLVLILIIIVATIISILKNRMTRLISQN